MTLLEDQQPQKAKPESIHDAHHLHIGKKFIKHKKSYMETGQWHLKYLTGNKMTRDNIQNINLNVGASRLNSNF